MKDFCDMRGGTILRLYDTFEGYVSDRRRRLGRPKLYEHIEWFCTRHTDSKPDIWQRLIERAIGRPMYGRNLK